MNTLLFSLTLLQTFDSVEHAIAAASDFSRQGRYLKDFSCLLKEFFTILNLDLNMKDILLRQMPERTFELTEDNIISTAYTTQLYWPLAERAKSDTEHPYITASMWMVISDLSEDPDKFVSMADQHIAELTTQDLEELSEDAKKCVAEWDSFSIFGALGTGNRLRRRNDTHGVRDHAILQLRQAPTGVDSSSPVRCQNLEFLWCSFSVEKPDHVRESDSVFIKARAASPAEHSCHRAIFLLIAFLMSCRLGKPTTLPSNCSTKALTTAI
ncbi:hypothetical protein HDU98_003824 [Podochytrium sp. JEL0797]|nr:hypothetical protein HDU98_003824 [Podochytrium sp. JEL0797]